MNSWQPRLSQPFYLQSILTSLKDFVNLTDKFNSLVVKTLKPVLCFPQNGVPLNFKNKSWRQQSLLVWIVWAWFPPLWALAGQYLQRQCPVRITWVEIGLNKLILKSYITGKISFWNLKESHSREEHKNRFQLLHSNWMNLLVEFTNPTNDGLCIFY